MGSLLKFRLGPDDDRIDGYMESQACFMNVEAFLRKDNRPDLAHDVATLRGKLRDAVSKPLRAA